MRLAATILLLLASSAGASPLPVAFAGVDVDAGPVVTSTPTASERPEAGAEGARARDQGARKQRFATVATSADLIHIGAALAFALLHLLLFAFYPREQGNLFFALFALAFAGMTWGAFRIDNAPPGMTSSELVATLRLTFTCGILQSFALQRIAHVVLLRATPWVFYLLLSWGTGVIAWIWMTPATTLRIQPVMYLALAMTVEMLRIVVLAARRPQPSGTWLIYLGLAVLAGAGALQSLLALEVLGPNNAPVYAHGVLLFLLAVSIYLSRRFATTAQELERQLDEVRRLSEKTIAQERRARESEVERRLLEAENERRARELEAARELQLSMLPGEPPAVPGLEVAFRTLTATEVGGDYYDFRVAGDGALTLAVGDATGHGLNAGIVVASTKSLFQGLDLELDLSESLGRINRGLRGMRLRRMAMSLTLARYEGGTLRIASAGMPPVLVFREATGDVEEHLLSAPPLGTFDPGAYPEVTTELASGDAVLLATDGLVELLDPDDEILGYPAVAEAFRVAAGAGQGAGAGVGTSARAEQTMDGLLARAQEWTRGRRQADDLSLVVLRAE